MKWFGAGNEFVHHDARKKNCAMSLCHFGQRASIVAACALAMRFAVFSFVWEDDKCS